jgi:hypothetical protein
MREKPTQSAHRRVVSFRLGACSSTYPPAPHHGLYLTNPGRLGSFGNGWTIIGRTRITQLVHGAASATCLLRWTAIAAGFVWEDARMRTITPRRFGTLLVASILLLKAAAIAGTADGKQIAVDSNHIAIKGYDTVAYFTDGKAVKGSSQFEYVFADATWQFSNAAHRGMFVADPDHYMPQYGGNCAAATAFGVPLPADPEAWTIVDGKLYMVASKKFLDQWKANSAENIKQADAHWHAVQQRQPVQQQ